VHQKTNNNECPSDNAQHGKKDGADQTPDPRHQSRLRVEPAANQAKHDARRSESHHEGQDVSSRSVDLGDCVRRIDRSRREDGLSLFKARANQGDAADSHGGHPGGQAEEGPIRFVFAFVHTQGPVVIRHFGFRFC